MARLVGVALAHVVLVASLASAGPPTLRLQGDWSVDRYAAVEVRGAGEGEHVLNGDGVIPVRWPGGRTVVLPVLVYPGAGDAVALTLDGRPVTLDVGAGEASPWPAGSPRVGVIDEAAYAATQDWRPGRPFAERAAFAASAGGFVVATALILWLVRRPGRRLAAVALLSLATTAGVVVWDRVRPTLATRRVEIAPRGGDVIDRWLFVQAPPGDPQPIRVAFVGTTWPVAFSRGHLQTLSPTLTCDAAGRPTEIALTLAPGTQAAILQRVDGATAPVDPPPAWARPLVRRLYDTRGRGVATD